MTLQKLSLIAGCFAMCAGPFLASSSATEPGIGTPTPGRIAGLVIEGPRGVGDVGVALVSGRMENIRMGRTHADGTFGFNDVRPGRYTLIVRVPGLGEGRAAVNVLAGETVRALVQLQ